MNEIKELGKIFKNFLKIVHKKLDSLEIINVLGLFFILLVVSVSMLGDAFQVASYALGDIFGQLFLNKSVKQNIDSTPMYLYIVFLLFGLLLCLLIVKWHKSGRLWKR